LLQGQSEIKKRVKFTGEGGFGGVGDGGPPGCGIGGLLSDMWSPS